MSVRSVHFGSLPFDPPQSKAEPQPAPVQANALQSFGDALRDTELVRNKLRGLIASDSRHGDLQITLSALRRIEDAVRVLIAAEES